VFVIPAERVTKLSLETDVERIHTVMQEIDPLAIVLDPLSAYMPKVDTHRDNEVRSALARFVAILKTTGTAAIFIIHMSKNVERTAMQRILGSTAFGALSRAAFLIARHPDHDPAAADDGRRVFVPTKFNLGRRPAGRSFVIESTMVEVDGIRIEAPVARWSAEAVKMHADEVLRQLARGGSNTKELDDAIRDILQGGPATTKDIEAKTGKAGTTLRRAKDRLHIVQRRDPAEPMTGAYYWIPPDWTAKQIRDWETGRMALREPPTQPSGNAPPAE
jgi:putative DNA primase/helicase